VPGGAWEFHIAGSHATLQPRHLRCDALFSSTCHELSEHDEVIRRYSVRGLKAGYQHQSSRDNGSYLGGVFEFSVLGIKLSCLDYIIERAVWRSDQNMLASLGALRHTITWCVTFTPAMAGHVDRVFRRRTRLDTSIGDAVGFLKQRRIHIPVCISHHLSNHRFVANVRNGYPSWLRLRNDRSGQPLRRRRSRRRG
jgi:hypothetical protein